MKSFFRFLLLVFIVLAGFIALAVYWTFYKPLPRYEASLTVPELRSPVTIYWSDFGVPSIFAQNSNDLYTALGYVHAQDRLWQMTLAQLFVEGRFAEFLGEDAIEFDKFSRTIGFWRIAGELEAEMDPSDLQLLQAYSNGVNRYLQDNPNRLPVEFSLAGIKPLPWSPRHSIALSRVLGWELNVSWWSKIMLGYLENHLPPAALRELFPTWDQEAPRTLSAEQTRRLTATLMQFLETELDSRKMLEKSGTHVGSNAWVADGTRTESGLPLLAGDPHLGLDMPGKWYEVHLNLNGKNLSGATIAGAPIVVLGQNDHLAWSFTSLMGDDTDFFIEQINPEDRGQYLADIQDTVQVYKPFKTVREIIYTREGREVLHEVRYTQNGPVINDIYQNKPLLDDQLISMRWTGFEKSFEIKGLTMMGWAEDFQQFQSGLEYMGVPGLNIMYGDINGNIAMFTAANLPVRRSPSLVFRKGWVSEQRWNAFIPKEHLPRVINPASGYIANANNPVVGENYPYYLTAFWEPDSRIRRIEEVLQSRRLHSSLTFKELQNDVFSHHARDLTYIILPVLETSEDTLIAAALPYLRNFDFNYTRNATAASLLDGFFLNFVESAFRPYFGDAVYENFIKLENFPIRITSAMLKETNSVWLQTSLGDTAYRDSLIITSMRESVLELYNRFGSETSEWRWENLHSVTFSPPLFGEAARSPDAPASLRLIVKNVLSKGPYPVGGHSMTVNNTQYDWANPYAQVLGASIRRIVDLADLSQSESVLPTGQSGNPLSRHYGDQSELWLTGKYRIFQHNNKIPDLARFRVMSLNP